MNLVLQWRVVRWKKVIFVPDPRQTQIKIMHKIYIPSYVLWKNSLDGKGASYKFYTHTLLIRREVRFRTGTLSVLFGTKVSVWFLSSALLWSIRSTVFSRFLLKIDDFGWFEASFCLVTPIFGNAAGLLTSVIRIAPSGDDFAFSMPENNAFASSKFFKSSVCDDNFLWISFGVFSISVSWPSVNRPSDCSISGDSSAELHVSTTRVSVP